MGEETMVIETLNEKLIQSGAELLKKLDDEKVAVDAAFWFYLPDGQKWKLVISLPEVIQLGTKVAYETVQNALGKWTENQPLSLVDVTIARLDDPLLKSMKTTLDTGPGVHGIRLTNEVISGKLIQDAYIYRLMGTKETDKIGIKKHNKNSTLKRNPVKA
jgi:hypothetical protein